MPGPGGGGFGGGGHGGGFGGGGRGGHGGGFGGPGRGPRPGPGGPWGPRGPRGPWGWRRRYYYGPRFWPVYFGPRFMGGGIAGILFYPIIFLVIFSIVLGSLFIVGIGEVFSGGDVVYSEEAFQKFTDDQYAALYSDTKDYEDHILIVVATYDDHQRYDYIVWVGDHVKQPVSSLFGNDYTTFGRTIERCVNGTNYSYSLDSNLADTVEIMADNISSTYGTAEGKETPFRCANDHTGESRFVNKTELSLTESTVESSLADFTARTGISCSIVVEDAVDIYGTTMSPLAIFGILVMAVCLILAVVFLVRGIKAKKEKEAEEEI